MLKTGTIFLVLQLNLLLVCGAKLPSSFQKCKWSDKACLKVAVQDALPKFAKGMKTMNIPGIDPLIVPKLEIPSGSGSVKITQTFVNSELLGLSKCKVDDVTFDVPGHSASFKFDCDQLKFKGNYEMNGQLLVFPVKGKGPMEIILDKVIVNGASKFKRESEGGEEVFRLESSTFTLDADHVSFAFENLFDGNKELSDNINKVMNENWKEVFGELKDSYNNGFKVFTDNIADTFFKQVPIKEIFLDA